MKPFLEKMNPSVSFFQKTPTRVRTSSSDIRNRSTNLKNNGLTGQALIDYVVKFIQEPKYHFSEERYDAIIIEDDKDDRFIKLNPQGIFEIDFDGKQDENGNGQDGWLETSKKYTQQIRNAIKSIDENYPEIPIIYLLAAPEVESWFLADWDNSFGSVYKFQNMGGLSAQQNMTFSIRFKQYIFDSILTSQYKDNIEAYGWFTDGYKKLSSEIQDSLTENDFLKDLQPHNPLYYSKQLHGQKMLQQIHPETVLQRCSKLFRSAYWEIKEL